MDQFLKSLAIAVAVAFIAPAAIALTRAIFGAGTLTVAAILLPIKKLIYGVLKIGQYIAIPIAAIVLFAPDSMRTIFPASSTLLGVCVLLVASIYLLYAMFGGLRQALAISFWACICIVVVSAFQLDTWLPQPEKKSKRKLGELLAQTEAAVSALPSKDSPRTQRPESDGLDVSSFALENSERSSKRKPTATEPLSVTAEKHYSSLERSVTEFLAPSINWMSESPKDQSFKGLPSEMYFEGKRSKKPRYGYADGQAQESPSSLGDFVTGFFKE